MPSELPPPPVELPAATSAELLTRWQEPHRRHHDVSHLAAVLAAIDQVGGGTADLVAVRLAAWFHDAVYDGGPDDEERSAVLARERLMAAGLDPALVDEVVRLVLLTATHDPDAGDDAGAVLCDADLAVLGAAPERYADYVAGVRAEYAQVGDAAWRVGRARVLQQLLTRQPLYRTPVGRRHWETTARANLTAELATLTG